MSSQNIPVLTLPVVALAAISAQTFVDATGNPAAAAGNALGAARSDAAVGEACPVDALGTGLVIAAEAIAAGGAIEVGANSQAAAHNAGVVVARAIDAAAAAGDVIEVMFIPN